MVSLRTNLWGTPERATLAAAALIAIGLGLTVLMLMGRVEPAKCRLLLTGDGETSFDLQQATRAVHRATSHSVERRIQITENWLQWTLGKVYPPLSRTQNAERLLAGSLTDCSERSQILKFLAEAAGHRTRFVGLNGHVVLEVETAHGWQVADPAYGVVYPLGIETLQEPAAVPLIHDTLAAAGHAPTQIDLYLDIVQTAGDNVLLPVGSPLSPRLAMIEEWCEPLAWWLPLGMIACGLALVIATNYRRRRGQTFRPSAAITLVACETGPRQPAA